MATYVLRIWLPDRPGALGAVASRIGAVRGDLVAIDILERGAGLAIDELVVVLPETELLPLLLDEIAEVDGVAVEDTRILHSDQPPDPRVAALATAAMLVSETDPTSLMKRLVAEVASDFEAEWVALARDDATQDDDVLHTVGDAPPRLWLVAFVAGSRAADPAPNDIATALLGQARLRLLAGRPGRPFRGREREQLRLLARIADAHWRLTAP